MFDAPLRVAVVAELGCILSLQGCLVLPCRPSTTQGCHYHVSTVYNVDTVHFCISVRRKIVIIKGLEKGLPFPN